MASVIFDEKELCGLMGRKLPAAELRERIDMLGMPVDAYDGGKFSLDITPNRTDLLSVEGMARALASFTGVKKGLRDYDAESSGMKLEIDRSVRGARPYIVMAYVKDANLTEELLLSLISIQEKIHDTFGRHRRKVSIGLHDADKVSAPFTYKAVKEFTFTPLDFDRPMTIAQILKEHPKGKDYAHLVQPGKYPMLLDSNAEVLSFPPIINGTITMLTPQTKNLLIDVTGTSEWAIRDALNVLCCLLADRGAQIFTVETTDGTTPDLAPRSMKFDYKKCNRLLGLALTEAETAELLSRMGHEYKAGTVRSPCYRADLLHWVDLAEDVAIAFDYNKLPQTLPSFSSIAKPLPDLSEVREAMLGLGYSQAISWTLTNTELNFSRLGLKPAPMASAINPLTTDFTSMRTHLLPSLLSILSQNTHHPMPQRIFELGLVYDAQGRESSELASASEHAGASFSEAKSSLEALLAEMNIQCKLVPKDFPFLAPGRSCAVMHNSKEVGHVGELAEEVRRNFGLELPVAVFSLRLWQ
ncbi:MAG: phenylalanine--tRNA ligase subunit beta [Candidatus Burarchaeum sp.]|nr:phenylalanine--tRNA ligase subunit beta [Candidatus Burarchaeum sp.]MDO8339165.1 phenylalanine--tRNA ligase subunit beta [Candidatus Burarchaeum sp.]